jgi:hypothetical protein
MDYFDTYFTARNIVKLLAFSAIGLLIFVLYNSNDAQQIKRWRKEKDRFMESSSSSPFEAKANFVGLKYFEPNTDWKLDAQVQMLSKAEESIFWTNDGKKSIYLKLAFIKFDYQGNTYSLYAYRQKNASKTKDGKEELFVPFKDKTNGKESYQSGRYIDLKIEENTQKTTIDFNYAYNPYCVYNYRYSCPLIPKENILPIRIEAGEINYP